MTDFLSPPDVSEVERRLLLEAFDSNRVAPVGPGLDAFEFMVLAAARAARRKADLVFATSTPLTVAVPGVLAAELRRVPFVFEVRRPAPRVGRRAGARPDRRGRGGQAARRPAAGRGLAAAGPLGRAPARGRA